MSILPSPLDDPFLIPKLLLRVAFEFFKEKAKIISSKIKRKRK